MSGTQFLALAIPQIFGVVFSGALVTMLGVYVGSLTHAWIMMLISETDLISIGTVYDHRNRHRYDWIRFVSNA